jgi:hypothetical protein
MWKPEIDYCVQNSPPLHSTLSQLHLAHFNRFSYLHVVALSGVISLGITTKILYLFLMHFMLNNFIYHSCLPETMN